MHTWTAPSLTQMLGEDMDGSVTWELIKNKIWDSWYACICRHWACFPLPSVMILTIEVRQTPSWWRMPLRLQQSTVLQWWNITTSTTQSLFCRYQTSSDNTQRSFASACSLTILLTVIVWILCIHIISFWHRGINLYPPYCMAIPPTPLSGSVLWS